MRYSKGNINRLGDRIRNRTNSIDTDDLHQLENYRIDHKEVLSEVFKILCTQSQKIYRSSIVTYRLKRFESIISKLDREPKMQLSRMWDIAGCRVILNNELSIEKFIDNISSELEIVKLNDYLKEPKDSGYQSVHLYVSIPGNPIKIEIQIRNPTHQNWATMVEISDFLFDAKLKEYNENKELFEFHKILANDISTLTLQQKKVIVRTLKKFQYLKELERVFSKNYLHTRKRWIEIRRNEPNYRYFLIISKKYEVPKIIAFKTFEKAEKEYFDYYKRSENANIVLTHTINVKYKAISLAYSNYILSYHSYLNKFYLILEDVILDYYKNHHLLKFYHYYKFYQDLNAFRLLSIVREHSSATKYLNWDIQNNKLKKKRQIKRNLEWIEELRKDIQFTLDENRKLHQEFSSIPLKNKFYSYSYRLIIKTHFSKFKRKVESAIKSN